MKYCGNCGSENKNGRFCTNCGARLDMEETTRRPEVKKGPSGVSVLLTALSVGVVGAFAFFGILIAVLLGVDTHEESPVPENQVVQQAEVISVQTQPTWRFEDLQPQKQEEPRRPVAVDGGLKHSVVLYNDGTVTTIGDDTYGQRSTSGWRSVKQISTFGNHTLGLKKDGTVVAAGANSSGQCDVENWKNIRSVAAGMSHSVGVREDGTVVAVGSNSNGQCNVGSWTNVKSVAASNTSTFAVTWDGKVLVCGSFENRTMNNWRDIVSISVSSNHVIGVHSDGTVSAVGANDRGQRDNLGKFSDIEQVGAGYGFSAGLRENGKVWVHGCDEHNEHAAMQWTDIVAIGTGTEHILGIKEDGTLVAKGTNDDGQCDVFRLNQELSGK